MNLAIFLITSIYQLVTVNTQETWQPVKLGSTQATVSHTITTIKLFHSFDQGKEWKPRGGIVVNSNDVVSVEKHQLTPDELENFKSASSSNGLYFLKAVAKNSDGSERVSSTVTKACAIYESSLSEVISIHLDLSGNFLSIAVAGTNPSCVADPTLDQKRSTFNSTVVVGHQVVGPIPDTQTYIQRVEQEKAERLRGDKQDNRSFLAKYWIYIVPLVIFMIVSSAANPEGGGN